MGFSLSDKSQGFIQLIFIIIFIVLAFVTSSLLRSGKPEQQSSKSKDRSIFVETELISPINHQVALETTGTIQAKTIINVVPEVTGKVTYVNDDFFQGGEFDENEILFKIDQRDYRLAVERSEAEVARSKTALTLEKAENSAAISEWKILNDGKAEKIPDLVARKPQMDQAMAELRASNANLKTAKLNLERTNVRLPFSGSVISSQIDKGSYVTAGQSVAQVFDYDAIEVKASIQDKQLKWLLSETEPEIEVEISYLGETKIYQGYLKRGTSVLNADTRFANLSFGIINSKGLLPGTFANIYIKGKYLNDVVKLPPTAIQKGAIAWAVDEQNRLKRIKPEIIYSTNDYVIVANIDKNTEIVTSIIDGGSEGMKVEKEQKEPKKPIQIEISDEKKSSKGDEDE